MMKNMDIRRMFVVLAICIHMVLKYVYIWYYNMNSIVFLTED